MIVSAPFARSQSRASAPALLLRAITFQLCFAAGVLVAADSDRAANSVILDETAVKNLNLTTAEVEESDFEETIFALGRIKVAPGRRAVISSRVPGRALSVSAHIDTRIEKGAEAVLLESRQPGEPPPTVRLLAPMTGYVSAVKVAPGQPVSAEDSLIEIFDLSAVHAVAAVPEHLASRVQIGQTGRIRAAGYPGRDFGGNIEHLGTEADAEAGTIEAAFHVDNPDEVLRPGMRAEFSIVTGKREAVMSVPREAVQGDGTQRFVYVADYELKNTFIKTPVVIGAQNDRLIEITSGLLPGDQVVTRGAYALVFAGKGSVSLKEALDAAHGHPHAVDGSELIAAEQAKGAGGTGSAQAGSPFDFTPLAMFFAATTALMLGLLVALGIAVRKRPTR
ncbi:MAG TPA: efflux RND transporter periplasmic adaptor subunit [Chthoniobacteraceae bacterium]|jgi:cobalt-zinc-cadmium efflux system membrane fusion protein|nr:efflux RND transporter periplasmic adaptor subunit [Chthoniobacteraceae bacterium]